MSKVTLVYVDDEIHQHVALEALIPEDWELHTFDKPLEAVEKIAAISPTIVISDQRMPGMPGFKFLEVTKQICPEAIRIITTGYSDENAIIESIRKAQIYDYLVKPWDVEKMLQTLERACAHYKSEKERKKLAVDLEFKNSALEQSCVKLEKIISEKNELQNEIKCWVHPFALKAAQENISFPLQKNLALIVFDIVNSSNLHGETNLGIELRTRILQVFSEVVLKHGGEVESHEGDKAYANFGLIANDDKISNAAFAAAKEFRSSLQGINDHFGTSAEAGIAIHYAANCNIHLRQIALNTKDGITIRKWFDTSSIDVDLCHRIESLTHKLPGSNIMLTGAIKERISATGVAPIALGSFLLKGQVSSSELFLIKSDKCSMAEVNAFIEYLTSTFGKSKVA